MTFIERLIIVLKTIQVTKYNLVTIFVTHVETIIYITDDFLTITLNCIFGIEEINIHMFQISILYEYFLSNLFIVFYNFISKFGISIVDAATVFFRKLT
ncbi:hypothetical protein GLOIN_2v1726677 [Rhizophagus irregularis DAOM 181602=DAOM 197198]|uniref:Uncharacterized protein n=1 Tax=Rhizophagus irregularis (strain DAOM 181602 / DAOM 197198 / MUCL 43194) TaxID=747089 RepID=A0A2P4P0M0_RHIID|nr:hypothetical protein GLOIN_2v1726677 [Rhizophagus irregularis DAOM 181602=DAOM 197198]POG58914.1 hypothetical protein GLOIN_2v1726677 [Rhizophagus irregularis DAOM 181602=DAOM 197198]|eukprot:XP_025165780.1 hypothetical protein GLOIN_2v1726677 [Rhizophagus irregularis DAOM 181602=DAOM 197198]